MLSQGERLRRLQESLPRVIAPTRLGDASMVTQRNRFASSARVSARPSDGQMTLKSAEFVVSGKARCSVCQDSAQETVVVECCPYPSVSNPAKSSVCCKKPYGAVKLADPRPPPGCCS